MDASCMRLLNGITPPSFRSMMHFHYAIRAFRGASRGNGDDLLFLAACVRELYTSPAYATHERFLTGPYPLIFLRTIRAAIPE